MSIGMNHCKVCSSPALGLEQKTRMLLGTALTVACTDTLVTLAKDGYVGMMKEQCRSFVMDKFVIEPCRSIHHRKVILKASF